MAKTSDAAKPATTSSVSESGVEGVSKGPAKREMHIVAVDTSAETLLHLDETMDLVFVPEAMPQLDEVTIREMSHENKRAYFMAEGQRKLIEQRSVTAKRNAADRTKPPQLWIEDPYAAQVEKQDRLLRKRPGWHQTWVRDDELEYFEAINWNGMGYRKVRSINKAHPEEKPGDETGEVIKLTDRFGTKEYVQIQMECPIELYEWGIKANVYKSKVGYSHDAMRTMAEAIEGKINARSGRQSERLSVIAESMEEKETFSDG